MDGTAGDRLQWLTPRRAVRISLVVVAGAALTIGTIALLFVGPPGASPAPTLTTAPDGEVHVAGTVRLNYVDATPGRAPMSHVTLHGAEGIDIQVAGSGAAGYGPGTFVELRGQKSASTVSATTITAATDPMGEAAPWLAFGAVILTGMLSTTIATAVQSLAARRAERPLRQPRSSSARPALQDDED